jgi:hypothetical protein
MTIEMRIILNDYTFSSVEYFFDCISCRIAEVEGRPPLSSSTSNNGMIVFKFQPQRESPVLFYLFPNPINDFLSKDVKPFFEFSSVSF